MTNLGRNKAISREASAGWLAAREGRPKRSNPHAERGGTAMLYTAWAAGWETWWQMNDGVITDEK